MPNYVVRPTTVTSEMLKDFSIYPITDETAVTELKEFRTLEASPLLLNFALRQYKWTPYQYADAEGVKRIGYNTTKGNDGVGLTETQSYSYWLEDFKNKERRFKSLFPLDSMTQSQYDAMVSLHYFTGRFEYVGTDICIYDLRDYIRERKWDHIGTVFIYNGADRMRTQAEAKIMMLGNYGRYTDRSLLKERGLQLIRGNYPNRIKDALARQQAEYIYYVETRRFLPGLTQARKRQIVDQEQRLS